MTSVLLCFEISNEYDFFVWLFRISVILVLLIFVLFLKYNSKTYLVLLTLMLIPLLFGLRYSSTITKDTNSNDLMIIENFDTTTVVKNDSLLTEIGEVYGFIKYNLVQDSSKQNVEVNVFYVNDKVFLIDPNNLYSSEVKTCANGGVVCENGIMVRVLFQTDDNANGGYYKLCKVERLD